MVSEYYESKKLKVTYGGKEYDICYLKSDPDDDDYKILLNDDIDGSIGTCELDFPASTWYTSIETAPDGKKYRVGNTSATVEKLKLYPFIFWGSTSSDSRATYWRKGKKVYSEKGQTGSYNFTAKINTFCIRVTGGVTNVRTGASHDITLNDLLNPDEESYISYMESENGYLLNYSTNKFDTNIRGIRPGALISGNTIGGVVDFKNLSFNNAGRSYFLSDGSEASSGSGYTMIKDLDSKAMVTPLLSDLNVDYPNKTYTFSGPWCIESLFTDTRQNIHFYLSLKFYVKILQSLGCYVTVDSLGTSLTFNENFLKNKSTVILGELDADGHPTFNWLTAEDRVTSGSPNINSDWVISDNTHGSGGGTGDDPNIKIDEMDMNFVGNNGGNFLNVYNCDIDAIAAISDWLNSRDLVTGYDPLSYNVTLLEYPMDLNPFLRLRQLNTRIRFGRVEHDEGDPDPALSEGVGNLVWDQVVTMDVGSFVLWKKFGDFRDYDPYTQCTVYIPFFGEIPIDVQLHAGKTISAKMAIDVGSGAAICCIFADNILISKVNATLANEVPLSSENWGIKRAAQMQATASAIGSVISAAATIGTVAVGGVKALAAKQALTTAVRATNTTSNLGPAQAGLLIGLGRNQSQASQNFSKTFDTSVIVSGIGNAVGSITNAIAIKNKSYSAISGSIGSRAEQAAPMRPFARVTRVKSVIPDQYGHERGYVCDFTARLGDLVGLTVTNNVDTSGLSCTAEERVQVKQILDSGVYL